MHLVGLEFFILALLRKDLRIRDNGQTLRMLSAEPNLLSSAARLVAVS